MYSVLLAKINKLLVTKKKHKWTLEDLRNIDTKILSIKRGSHFIFLILGDVYCQFIEAGGTT